MKNIAFPRFCFFVLLLFCVFGCPRQNEALPSEIKAFHSGDLRVDQNKDAPKTIYIDVRNTEGLHPLHVQTLGSALSRDDFQLVESPSKAGYILHLSILQEGPVDATTFEKLVQAGYGGEAKFSGTGATGMLADALLVQRMVPTASRPSRARMKNISKRNAIDSSQMRLGLLAPADLSGKPGEHALFSDALVREILNAIAVGGRAEASN